MQTNGKYLLDSNIVIALFRGEETVCQRITILACDTDTARKYGRIKAALLAIGCPIPENDIWIAGMAIRYRLLLVTRDTHFEAVAGLERETW